MDNKIEIQAQNGDYYTYDLETDFITKNGMIVSSQLYQPLFTYDDTDNPPIFSGIWNRSEGTIIGISGKANPVRNSKAITL